MDSLYGCRKRKQKNLRRSFQIKFGFSSVHIDINKSRVLVRSTPGNFQKLCSLAYRYKHKQSSTGTQMLKTIVPFVDTPFRDSSKFKQMYLVKDSDKLNQYKSVRISTIIRGSRYKTFIIGPKHQS